MIFAAENPTIADYGLWMLIAGGVSGGLLAAAWTIRQLWISLFDQYVLRSEILKMETESAKELKNLKDEIARIDVGHSKNLENVKTALLEKIHEQKEYLTEKICEHRDEFKELARYVHESQHRTANALQEVVNKIAVFLEISIKNDERFKNMMENIEKTNETLASIIK